MTKEKNAKSKKLRWLKIFIMFVGLVGVIVTVLVGSHDNVSDAEKQLQQNLNDVAEQNALVLYSKVQSNYDLLKSLSTELVGVTPETIDSKLNHFKMFLDDYELKRFAATFKDGSSYSTDTPDGEAANLSYREFLQRALEGKCTITETLTDAIGGEQADVNVMTVPMYTESGEVNGAFGVAYDTNAFSETLLIDSFGGQGFSCVINEDGKIMAIMENEQLSVSHNIFKDTLHIDEQNKQTIGSLKQIMYDKEEGSGVLYLPDKHYYSCVPVDLMDGSFTWYILTIIPSDVLNQRISAIQVNQFMTSLFVAIFIGIDGILIVFLLKEQHKRIVRYAYEDSYTNGPNYMKFCMDMEKRKNKKGYIVLMDIANFDNINIAAGETASAAMLRKIWNIINNSLNKDELAGHVRDDIFVLFVQAHDDDSLIERMENISDLVKERAKEFKVYGVRPEYGIYRMFEDETVENAYSKAKMAIDYVKNNANIHYAYYSEANRVKTQREKWLEDRFPISIKNKEFEVWYQPKYSAKTGKIVGSEALVRWRKADGELISPGEFIPLFEKNGMIIMLDEYMFRNVCAQQKKWFEEGKPMYPVSVNVSRASLYRIDITKKYIEIMKESGVDSKYIQIEVTESALGGKQNVYEILNKFRSVGIKILMDDFGTGYSSLTSLSTQCFDTLKLDKSLIDNIGEKNGETLLGHVIQMGQQMNLHITAEGVENQEQVKFLQEMNCDDIQGFFFSRPLPMREYEALLETGNEGE